MEVGREIRHIREGKGWSQTKLAAAADMGVSGISQIETGARNPSATTLWKIAEALGVEVGDLYPKEQAPLPDLDGERRAPSLRSWIDFVNRLADRWEKEIEEREQEWQAAKPAIRKHVKRLPNLNWAKEIRETAADTMAITNEELERGILIYDTAEALELFRAVKRLGQAIDQTNAWYRTDADDAPQVAQVYDFQEALKRMERKIGARAS